MKASGKIQISTPSEAERAAWAASAAQVHKEMASRVGPDIIKAIYDVTGAPK